MTRKAFCSSCNTGALRAKLAGCHCLTPSNWSVWPVDGRKRHTGRLLLLKENSTASFSREETNTPISLARCSANSTSGSPSPIRPTKPRARTTKMDLLLLRTTKVPSSRRHSSAVISFCLCSRISCHPRMPRQHSGLN